MAYQVGTEPQPQPACTLLCYVCVFVWTLPPSLPKSLFFPSALHSSRQVSKAPALAPSPFPPLSPSPILSAPHITFCPQSSSQGQSLPLVAPHGTWPCAWHTEIGIRAPRPHLSQSVEGKDRQGVSISASLRLTPGGCCAKFLLIEG